MKKDAYYFPHYCNARSDRKIKRLIKQLGVEGYGIFFMILETLREQTDFKYPVEDIDLLADEFGTSETKVRAVVTAYDLFAIDENTFFSPKQVLYLQPYLEKSQRARDAARLRWDKVNEKKDAFALPEHSKSIADQNASKVKESKVKEKKVKESKEEKLLARELAFYESLKDFVSEYSKETIREFYDYWREPNKSKSKMLWETKPTWDLKLRLARWAKSNFNSPKSKEVVVTNTDVPKARKSCLMCLTFKKDQASYGWCGAVYINSDTHEVCKNFKENN
jgi:hypothetical protein